MSSINRVPATSGHQPAGDQTYPACALDAIVRVHLAENAPQLLERLMSATAAIGATASIYTVAIPGNGTEPSSFSLFACHPGFAQQQCRLGPLVDHPWFRFAKTRSAPATDQQVQLEQSSDAEAIELARRYGFTSCLIVPTSSGVDPERVEMLCLGSTRGDAFEGEDARMVRTLARALAAELHDWVTRHLSESLQEAARLHETDIELLRLEWQGLSTKEIALKTGMSTAMVDSRFQRLNARLQCASRKASARRAAAYGLLEGA